MVRTNALVYLSLSKKEIAYLKKNVVVILSYCESHVFYVRRMRAWLIRERNVVSLNLLLVPASVFSSCVGVRKLVFSFLQVCIPTSPATNSPITQTSSYMRIKKKKKVKRCCGA